MSAKRALNVDDSRSVPVVWSPRPVQAERAIKSDLAAAESLDVGADAGGDASTAQRNPAAVTRSAVEAADLPRPAAP